VTIVEQPSGPAMGPRRKNFTVDRNKRSLALNLKEDRAREILYRLIADADVFIEGFRPGVAERLGINYAKLSKLNPGLIYCSVSGYGQDGPYRLRPGHDINYMATAGMLYLNGRKETGPVVCSTQLGDIAGGGMMAAFAVLSALYYREKSGKGQYIDVSITDAVLALNPVAFVEYDNAGTPPERQGFRNIGATPCYNIYRTKDGQHVSIGALEPMFWANLCRLLGREDLIARQNETGEEGVGELQRIFETKTRNEWDRLLDSEEVCYAPILNLAETFKNSQVVHRKMIHEAIQPDGSTFRQADVVPRLSLTPGTLRRPPSRPGQHTREILEELGMDETAIAGLEREGVIKASEEE